MTKKLNFFLLLIVITIFITGCTNIGTDSTENDSEETKVTMTQEEKEFLLSIFINKEPIENGNLFNYQKITLEQYRYAKEVLEKKYPSYSFEITSCTPKNVSTEYAVFYFKERGNDDIYNMDVYCESDNSFYEEDDFYTKIINDDMTKLVNEKLQEFDSRIYSAKSNVFGLRGIEYDENININEIISGELEISCGMTVYVLVDTMTETEKDDFEIRLKDYVSKEGLVGSYTVKIIDNVNLCEKIDSGTLNASDCLYQIFFQNY